MMIILLIIIISIKFLCLLNSILNPGVGVEIVNNAYILFIPDENLTPHNKEKAVVQPN